MQHSPGKRLATAVFWIHRAMPLYVYVWQQCHINNTNNCVNGLGKGLV